MKEKAALLFQLSRTYNRENPARLSPLHAKADRAAAQQTQSPRSYKRKRGRRRQCASLVAVPGDNALSRRQEQPRRTHASWEKTAETAYLAAAANAASICTFELSSSTCYRRPTEEQRSGAGDALNRTERSRINTRGGEGIYTHTHYIYDTSRSRFVSVVAERPRAAAGLSQYGPRRGGSARSACPYYSPRSQRARTPRALSLSLSLSLSAYIAALYTLSGMLALPLGRAYKRRVREEGG